MGEKTPALIKTAIANAEAHYSCKGYKPNPGSTQLFELGKRIYELTRNKLGKAYYK